MPIARIGPEIIVNTTAQNAQSSPDGEVLSDGRTILVWHSHDSGNSNIRARFFDADGNPAGNDFVLNTTTVGVQYSPVVTALANGRFFVAWESDENPGPGSVRVVRGCFFNADGTQEGADFIVNTTAGNGRAFPM
jgi:hypothetical protein